MLLFLIWIVVVTILGSIKAGLASGILFTALLLIIALTLSMLLILVLSIIGQPYFMFQRRKYDKDKIGELRWGIQQGTVLTSICNILADVLMILFVIFYQHGKFILPGLVGVGLMLVINAIEGDLPFQKPKNIA